MADDGRHLSYTVDKRAEDAVLSTVLLDPPRLAEVRPLLPTPDAFYDPRNRLMYEAAIDLDERGEPVDPVTVAKRLTEMNRWGQVGSAYIAEIMDATPAVVNVETHARIVRDKWRLRVALANSLALAAQIKSGAVQTDEDVQAALEGAEAIFGDLAHQQSQRTLRHVRDVLLEADAGLQAAKQRGNSLTGIDTGFSRLNAMLAGLHDGDLVILAARPGAGKTGLAMNIVTRVGLHGYGAAVFSMEMPDVQLGFRILAAEAKVNMGMFRTPTSMRSQDWQNITNAIQTLAKAPIWIDDTPAITVPEIRSRVRKLKAEIKSGRSAAAAPHGLRLVVVDYLQLCGVREQRGKTREQQVGEVSRALKALAMQEQLCVLGLSQLNRSVETRDKKDKRPQLSDLRESGSIEQDADTVLFVFRPDMYPDHPDEVKGLAEIIIGKQRNGPTGTVSLKFTKEYVRFDTLADEGFDMYDPADDDGSWFDDRTT